MLGIGEGKGQGIIEGTQIQISVFGNLLSCPGLAHQGQAGTEQEEFFEDQPLFGKFCFCQGLGIMNGLIGPGGGQNSVGFPNGCRNDLLRRIAQAQGLAKDFQNIGIAQACGERIQRQNPPGGDPRGVGIFKYRVGHAITGVVAA